MELKDDLALSSTINHREYPDPPNLHWALLLLLLWGISFIVSFLSTELALTRYANLIDSIVGDAWIFYICLFMKRLNDNAKSYIWGDISIVLQLLVATLGTFTPTNLNIGIRTILLLTLSITSLVTIFTIQGEIERHYNNDEPDYPVVLSGVMTFFFSFIYFQYQFNDINRRKRQDRTMKASASGYTLNGS